MTPEDVDGTIRMEDIVPRWTKNGWMVEDLAAMWIELGDLFNADAHGPRDLVELIKGAMPPGRLG